MSKKRTIKTINSIVNEYINYQKIENKLDFSLLSNGSNFHKENKFFKYAFSILPLSFVAVIISSITTILIGDINKKPKLVPITEDEKVRSLLSLSNYESVFHIPSFDEVYESYQSYKNSENQNYPFFCETTLSTKPFFYGIYLSNDIIKIINDSYEKSPVLYMVDLEGNLNYLRYYKYLLDNNSISNKDVLYYQQFNISDAINLEIDTYHLIKVIRTINIENKEFANAFIEDIPYKPVDELAIVDTTYRQLADCYENKKILVANVPQIKKLNNSYIPNAYLMLNVFTYIINETNGIETFSSIIKCYSDEEIPPSSNIILQIDQELKNIIINQSFIESEKIKDSSGEIHYYHWYDIECNYQTLKELFFKDEC